MKRSVGVFIGVNSYKVGSGFSRLQFCANDAELMEKTFAQHSINEAVAGATDYVRKADVLACLELLSEESLDADDAVIFHFSGHGFSRGGSDYLAFSDSWIGDPTTCLPVSQLASGLRESGAGKFLLLLDCCRSLLDRSAGTERFALTAATRDELYDASIFTGCRIGQTSQEHSEIGSEGYGVFTWAFTRVVSAGERVPLATLNDAVIDESRRICAALSLEPQEPQLVAPMRLGGFDFVKLEEVTLSAARRPAIILSGPTEAGKTTVGHLLQAAKGFMHLEMSSYVKARQHQYSDEGNGEISRQDFVEQVVWGAGNYDAIAQDAIADLSQTRGGVVITGARRPEEVEAFLAANFDCLQVYLHANSKIRWARLIRANDDFYTPAREEFIRRNLREFDWGLAKIGLMRDCNFVLNEAMQAQPAVDDVIRLYDEKHQYD